MDYDRFARWAMSSEADFWRLEWNERVRLAGASAELRTAFVNAANPHMWVDAFEAIHRDLNRLWSERKPTQRDSGITTSNPSLATLSHELVSRIQSGASPYEVLPLAYNDQRYHPAFSGAALLYASYAQRLGEYSDAFQRIFLPAILLASINPRQGVIDAGRHAPELEATPFFDGKGQRISSKAAKLMNRFMAADGDRRFKGPNHSNKRVLAEFGGESRPIVLAEARRPGASVRALVVRPLVLRFLFPEQETGAIEALPRHFSILAAYPESLAPFAAAAPLAKEVFLVSPPRYAGLGHLLSAMLFGAKVSSYGRMTDVLPHQFIKGLPVASRVLNEPISDGFEDTYPNAHELPPTDRFSRAECVEHAEIDAEAFLESLAGDESSEGVMQSDIMTGAAALTHVAGGMR